VHRVTPLFCSVFVGVSGSNGSELASAVGKKCAQSGCKAAFWYPVAFGTVKTLKTPRDFFSCQNAYFYVFFMYQKATRSTGTG